MTLALRIASLLLVLLRPLPSAAEATPVGPEFQANDYTTNAQDIPEVAGTPDGGFVVVWQSKDQGGGDLDDIFVRRYTAAGTPAADELQLNTFTTGNQQRPAVAVDGAGNFVVVWQSYEQDGSDFGIFGRRLTAAGTPDGGEFAVSQFTTGKQIRPAVAAASDGTFTVAWASALQDGDGYGVFARRFPPGGTPPGAEFQLNAWTTGSQYHPGIDTTASGDFVVVWDTFGQDGDGLGVVARRYSSSGAPTGPEFQVNTYTTLNQYRPVLATTPGGDFVVAWNGPGAGDAFGIFAQRFDAANAPVGGEFHVNTYTTQSQYRPAVAVDVAGNFVVVWQSYNQDAYLFGVFGQQFRYDGATVGAEFQCNTYTTFEQGRAAVGMQPNGDFVVAWRSYSQDGSNYGAFVRRFAGPIATTTTSTTLPGATSTTLPGGGTTTTTLPPTVPVALRSLLIRPDALLKVAVPGPLGLADPTATGATLAFTGTTGGASYDLPAACWQTVRKRGATKGYRCTQASCKVALLAKKGLRAICRRTTGDFGPLPEAGPVSVTLGAAGTTYCGSCGGTAKGKATKLFKRTGCTAPAACP